MSPFQSRGLLFSRKSTLSFLSQSIFYCLGAFVLTALYDVPRFTGDLDYIEVVPRTAVKEIEKIAGKDSALYKKYGLFLQTSVLLIFQITTSLD